MPHLDPERLIFIALAEDHEEWSEADHLAHCAGCRHEMAVLRDVADIGSRAHDVRDLLPPPERVWRGVEAAIARHRHRRRRGPGRR